MNDQIEVVFPGDQPCGCRIGVTKDRLCSYHEGYNDGWEAGQKALGAVSSETYNYLMCDDCNSPEEHETLCGGREFQGFL